MSECFDVNIFVGDTSHLPSYSLVLKRLFSISGQWFRDLKDAAFFLSHNIDLSSLRERRYTWDDMPLANEQLNEGQLLCVHASKISAQKVGFQESPPCFFVQEQDSRAVYTATVPFSVLEKSSVGEVEIWIARLYEIIITLGRMSCILAASSESGLSPHRTTAEVCDRVLGKKGINEGWPAWVALPRHLMPPWPPSAPAELVMETEEGLLWRNYDPFTLRS